MTNQYALGYKAGLETAVKVCRDVVDSVSTTVHEQKLIDLVLEQAALRIAALPVQEVPLPKTLEGGYELCEDEGCPHRGTVHYCRSVPEFKWRDLTDEEIEAIAKENDTWSLFKSLRIFDFANAVTAKFKEKQRV